MCRVIFKFFDIEINAFIVLMLFLFKLNQVKHFTRLRSAKGGNVIWKILLVIVQLLPRIHLLRPGVTTGHIHISLLREAV